MDVALEFGNEESLGLISDRQMRARATALHIGSAPLAFSNRIDNKPLSSQGRMIKDIAPIEDVSGLEQKWGQAEK